MVEVDLVGENGVAVDLIKVEDLRLNVGGDLDGVLDRVELAELLKSDHGDPEGSGLIAIELSRVTKLADVGRVESINTLRGDGGDGKERTAIRSSSSGEVIDGVLTSVDSEQSSSLSDTGEANLEEEVLVVLRLKVEAVVLDVGADGEVKVTSVDLSVDGGSDLLVLLEDVDRGVPELDNDLSTTRGISKDVVASLKVSASGHGGDRASRTSSGDGASKRLTLISAIVTRVVRSRLLVSDGEGGSLSGVNDLSGDREGELEDGTSLSVFEVIVELNR